MAEAPVVRVSILRMSANVYPKVREQMIAAQAQLEPGVRAMSGLIDFFAGEDPATSSMTNVSLWRTLADAQQLDRFEPMLELGRRFVAEGVSFERPIMNYATLWRLEGSPGS
jgi:hypothetical protein